MFRCRYAEDAEAVADDMRRDRDECEACLCEVVVDAHDAALVVEAVKELANKVSDLSEEIITKKITIKNTDNLSATGITIYDRKTGEPVCMFVENGDMRTESGECGSASSNDGGSVNNVTSSSNSDPVVYEGTNEVATTTEVIQTESVVENPDPVQPEVTEEVVTPEAESTSVEAPVENVNVTE